MNLLCLSLYIVLFQYVKSEILSCEKWSDYFWFGSKKNCYVDPDLYQTIPEILTRYGKKFVVHNVTTEDDWILTAYQIMVPKPQFKYATNVAVLQHGLGQDGGVFLMGGNKSIAFEINNHGHEVWIINARGTRYSKHKKFSTKDSEYWDFSFHEIGMYDYPPLMEHIMLSSRRGDLCLLAHGMATSANLVGATLAGLSKRVKVMIQIGPLAIMKNLKTPFRFFIPCYKFVKIITDVLRVNSIFNPRALSTLVIKSLVHLKSKKIVAYALSLIYGWTPNEMDPTLVNYWLTSVISPIPVKQLWHYAMMYTSGKFLMYDYGKKKNMVIYKSEEAPEYPLEKNHESNLLVCSDKDWISTVDDMYLLNDRLDKKKSYSNFIYNGSNHLDSLYGKNRMERLYTKIAVFLTKI